MTRWKRTLTIMAVLGALVLAATTAMAAGQKDAGSAAAPMDISWFGLYGETVEDGNTVQRHLEEKFNVKLSNRRIGWDFEKVKLMISSGEMTDALYFILPMNEYFLKGAFEPISKEMILKHAPLYATQINSYGDTGWFYGLVPDTKDTYMGLVRTAAYKKGTDYAPFFRLDWLEKIGMAPKDMIDVLPQAAPGRCMFSKTPFTFDEFEKVLMKFRDGDLDGNGKADTIPFGSMGPALDGARNIGGLLYTFGLNGADNYNDNGKTVKMAIHSNFRAALKQLQKWFQARLLDTELPNVDQNKWRDKVANNITGGFYTGWSYQITYTDTQFDPYIPQLLLKRNPQAKSVVMPVPLAPDGTRSAAVAMGTTDLDDVGLFVVKKGTSQEKLAKILEIYDYVNYDPKGMVYCTKGWPGQHFTWEGEEWNSYARPIPGVQRGADTGIGYYAANSRHARLYFTYEVAPEEKLMNDYFYSGEGASYAKPQYREDLFKKTQYVQMLAKYRTALDTIRDEFAWKAIVTDMNIDAEWDAYVSKWLKSGGSEVLAEISKAPIVSELRKGKVVY